MKQFEKVLMKRPKSAVHDLSHEVKLTCNMGDLIPVLCQEVLPGDKFNVTDEMLVRMQALISPMMHRVNVYVHYFYVPNRLIWDDWQDFMTGGKLGNLAPNHPKITGSVVDWKDYFGETYGIGSLFDYLGLPVERYCESTTLSNELLPPISMLPFRAYQKIYNDWYRNQNFEDEVGITTDSLDRNIADAGIVPLSATIQLRKRMWEKDYFTSCLPTPQRGATVLLPLAGEAPVNGRPYVIDPATNLSIKNASALGSGADGKLLANGPVTAKLGNNPDLQPESDFVADLTDATSTSIFDLRRAYAVQRFLEKLARGGARYIEFIQEIFGVKSSDARLQRSEYLGGGRMPVRIGEVLQTSQTDATPQGNMAGHGVAGGDIIGFKRFFEEHGFVIGILSITPRTAYQEGLNKMFSRFDRFDYFIPDLAHIGEQPVLRQELYLDNADVTKNDDTFGYQPRNAEYRYAYDRVCGQMRTTLSYWHLGRIFGASNPLLNKSFVECEPEPRVFAVNDVGTIYGQFIIQIYHRIIAKRPVPKHGNPI